MVHRILLALAAAIVLAGCENSSVAPTDIVGDTWQLVSLQESGSAPTQVDEPARYKVQFGRDGRLSVTSDCNSCGGSYSLTESSLDVSPLACTKVFCGDRSLDNRFTAALEHAQALTLANGEMAIRSGGVTLRFRN